MLIKRYLNLASPNIGTVERLVDVHRRAQMNVDEAMRLCSIGNQIVVSFY
ncbi:hypothetical protein [Erythrobacter sp. AP23]|nr:hypothetical protein [Erythrobacter sp. AP23]